jgi:hypothetical protein
MEVGGEPASEGAQAFEQCLPIGRARDHERARTGGEDLDVVALLQLERVDDRSGNARPDCCPIWKPAWWIYIIIGCISRQVLRSRM